MDAQRTTPLGLLTHAREFFQAADWITNKSGDRVFLPTYYLLGHSVELALKAFLLGRGVSLKVLKKSYGHNLEALLIEARRRKLGHHVKLKPIEVGVIRLLNYDYVAKRFEYRETGTYTLPQITVTWEATKKLVSGLRPFCAKTSV